MSNADPPQSLALSAHELGTQIRQNERRATSRYVARVHDAQHHPGDEDGVKDHVRIIEKVVGLLDLS